MLRQAIDDQPNSPHAFHNFLGYGHVPTNRGGPANNVVNDFVDGVMATNPPPFGSSQSVPGLGPVALGLLALTAAGAGMWRLRYAGSPEGRREEAEHKELKGGGPRRRIENAN